MSERSHPEVRLGQQLYAVLERCRKPDVLWAKLSTGHYDWLGVRRNGRYVLGRPRLSAVVPDGPGPPPDDATAPHRTAPNVSARSNEFLGGRPTPRRRKPARPSAGW